MFESILAAVQVNAGLVGAALAAALGTMSVSVVALAAGVGGWLLAAWLIMVVLCVRGARERGRSGWGWFFLALLLSPLLAAVMLLVLPERCAQRQRYLAARAKAGLRLCPSCAEAIRAEARCCRYCGVDLERRDRQAATQSALARPQRLAPQPVPAQALPSQPLPSQPVRSQPRGQPRATVITPLSGPQQSPS